MTKKNGIKVTIVAFMEVDRKNFASQAAAFSAMAQIESTGKLPDGFFDTASIVSATGRMVSMDVEDEAAAAPATAEQYFLNDATNERFAVAAGGAAPEGARAITAEEYAALGEAPATAGRRAK